MKRPYQVAGVVLVLLGAFMTREALLLRFYTPQGPGPGLFPLLVSVMLVVLGAAIWFQATFRASDPMPADFFPSRSGFVQTSTILLALLAVATLMKPLGFRLTTMLFLIVMLLTLGRQKLLTTSIVALAGSFGVYHLFVEWLSTPLPKGMFGF